MTIHDCDRAFARIDCGLLHYRHVTPHEESPERAANLLPSVLMHASPSSSRSLQSLALALANSARGEVIAPDTPGNGDSAPLRQATPELADYASAMVQLLDELKIERANLYGFTRVPTLRSRWRLPIPREWGEWCSMACCGWMMPSVPTFSPTMRHR